MFLKQNYKKFAECLNTSEEILFAIEQVAGDRFEYDDVDIDRRSRAYDLWTEAFSLWDEGDQKEKILAAMPKDNGGMPFEEGTEVFWAWSGKFAEFDGEKWVRA